MGPTTARVEKILSSLTIEEKVAQLLIVPLDLLLEGERVSTERMRELLANGIGAIRRAAGARAGLGPRRIAEAVNEVQRFLVNETRPRLPAIVREESLAGLLSPLATAFPQPIALASSWSPSLVREVAETIRDQMLAVGARQSFAPVLDLCLDPRWGRCEETFGEDPYLAAVMGVEYVRGLQGDDLRRGVIATPKHFAGHGAPEGGRNRAPLRAGPRELMEVHLFPFEAAVRAAGARSIMAAYHDIDGVPCHANRWLLTDLLRHEWGFEGYVVSDGHGVEMLMTLHRVARDCEEAAVMALSAGVDSENTTNIRLRCFETLAKAVESGRVPEALVDEAVRRVLKVKEELGLLDSPYVDLGLIRDSLDDERSRALARRAAVSSIVMLKNDGTLPLPKDLKSVAVVGPNADDPLALLGDYHFPNHYGLDRPTVRVVTPLEAIRSRLPSARVLYARGCADQRCLSDEGFDEALRAASDADYVIAVLGDRSGIDPRWHGRGFSDEPVTTGENIDRDDVGLPGLQGELLARLAKAGRPLVLVLINGRPLSIARELGLANAVLEAWLPGEEGGNAIADVLFGDEDPGGRLPVTVPGSVGQLPMYYYMRPSSWAQGYMGSELRPLFPFGYGLSYARFSYAGLSVEPSTVDPDGEVMIRFTVRNESNRRGVEVAQVYVSEHGAPVARPLRRLVGFARLELGPGASAEVKVAVPADLLARYDESLRLVIEEGEYGVEVGSSSEDVRLRGSFRVSERRVLRLRRRYISEAEVRALG